MDENPYKAPSEDRRQTYSAAVRGGLLETFAIAIVWTFNAAIVGLILIIVYISIFGVFGAWRVR